jgi:hypothetical protein
VYGRHRLETGTHAGVTGGSERRDPAGIPAASRVDGRRQTGQLVCEFEASCANWLKDNTSLAGGAVIDTGAP